MRSGIPAAMRPKCDPRDAAPNSRHADVDQIVNQLEVVGVQGQQRHAVDIRGRGDRQVEGTAPGLAAALRDGGIEAAALARRCRLEGQRIEAFLDRAEPAQPYGPNLLIRRDENAEVKLGEGDDADRDIVTGILTAADEDRGVK